MKISELMAELSKVEDRDVWVKIGDRHGNSWSSEAHGLDVHPLFVELWAIPEETEKDIEIQKLLAENAEMKTMILRVKKYLDPGTQDQNKATRVAYPIASPKLYREYMLDKILEVVRDSDRLLSSMDIYREVGGKKDTFCGMVEELVRSNKLFRIAGRRNAKLHGVPGKHEMY
jgi:hypothetical protein